MSKSNKKDYLTVGFAVAVLSFVLLFIGTKFVLGNEIAAKNIVALAGFSIAAGTTASLLVFYELKIILISLIIGLTVGFILMYRVFLQEASDWRNLIGLLSLFIFTVISTGAGVLIQLGYHFFEKWSKDDEWDKWWDKWGRT